MIGQNFIIILVAAFYAIIYLLIKKSLGRFSKYNFIYIIIIFFGLCFSLHKVAVLVTIKFQKNKEINIEKGFDISGDWCLFSSDGRARIINLGRNNYRITNERNMVSSAYLIEGNKIVAEDWGELVGEQQLIDRIVWKNGTVWMRCKKLNQ